MKRFFESPWAAGFVSVAVGVTVSVILILMSGCLTAPGGIETADVYKVYNQDKAMVYANGEFNDRYNTTGRAFDRATVYWTDTQCPYADGWAVVVDGRCYYGIMYGCDEMYVAMNPQDGDQSTCRTALIHEFGHCLRMNQEWGGDSDHSELRMEVKVAEDGRMLSYQEAVSTVPQPAANGDFWHFIDRTVRQETCDRGW